MIAMVAVGLQDLLIPLGSGEGFANTLNDFNIYSKTPCKLRFKAFM